MPNTNGAMVIMNILLPNDSNGDYCITPKEAKNIADAFYTLAEKVEDSHHINIMNIRLGTVHGKKLKIVCDPNRVVDENIFNFD